MQLVNDGFAVTLIGMTVVFVLLTVLVGIIQGMSAFCKLILGSEPDAGDASAIDDEVLSVIAAALRRYRGD
jgi:sodium pump decarboxylase gamma subunit